MTQQLPIPGYWEYNEKIWNDISNHAKWHDEESEENMFNRYGYEKWMIVYETVSSYCIVYRSINKDKSTLSKAYAYATSITIEDEAPLLVFCENFPNILEILSLTGPIFSALVAVEPLRKCNQIHKEKH